MAQICQTLAWRSQKGGDKATLKRICGHKNFMEKWSCTSVALHCCCSGTALLLGYESSPAAVAMQCQTSSKVLPRQRENFATEMGELCFSDRCVLTIMHGGLTGSSSLPSSRHCFGDKAWGCRNAQRLGNW